MCDGQRLTNSFQLCLSTVPVADYKAVVDVEGIPEGNDYFAVFMDSYDGTVRPISPLAGRLLSLRYQPCS